MRQVDHISLAKAILWEEAKGKLRAIAAAEGESYDGVREVDGTYYFQKIEKAVEEFIQAFEDEGYHE